MTKRLKVGGAIVLASVLVAAAAIVIFLQWANHPANGVAYTGSPVASTTEAPKEPVNIQTNYFTAQLPTGFEVKRQNITSEGPTLVELVANNEHQQFAITIAKLPPEGLSGTGSYNLRVTKTDEYQAYRPAGMPVAVTAFRALTGPPAFAAFWPEGSLYAQIALTSDGGATLNDLFNSFVQTTHMWEWK